MRLCWKVGAPSLLFRVSTKWCSSLEESRSDERAARRLGGLAVAGGAGPGGDNGARCSDPALRPPNSGRRYRRLFSATLVAAADPAGGAGGPAAGVAGAASPA